MIVTYKQDGWEIITQRTHGLVAAKLASHWRTADRPLRWIEFLIAVADHDDAQIELQRDDLLTPQGGPCDFKMKEFQLEHGLQTIEFAMSKSRYVALLSSMHLAFIAGQPEAQTPAVREFLKAQKKQQTLWRRQLGMKDSEAKFDYSLLEWCDALSLLICQHDNQPKQRSIEISLGPDNVKYNLVQPESGMLTVRPWPFAEDEFEIQFERRILEQLKFSSCKHFKKSFLQAAVKENCWVLKKT